MRRTPLGAPHTFESERLRFRPPGSEHGATVAAGVIDSHDALRKWMPWAEPRPTVASQTLQQHRSRMQFLADEEHHWLIFRRNDDAFVGVIGMPRPRRGEGVLEIGYWLRTSLSGKGYMQEAAARLTRVGFDELGARAIEIHTSSLNRASRRVAERAGYDLLETRLGDGDHSDGSARDTCVYGLDRAAFVRQREPLTDVPRAPKTQSNETKEPG